MEEAIARYGRPEIFNTDQGRQFTSADFTGMLTAHGIRIRMDGQGCWRDNIFVLGRYLTLYHTRRRPSSLADTTPDEAHFLTLRSPLRVAA